MCVCDHRRRKHFEFGGGTAVAVLAGALVGAAVGAAAEKMAEGRLPYYVAAMQSGEWHVRRVPRRP